VSDSRPEIRRLLAAATPGPWNVVTVGAYEVYVYAPDARYDALPGNPSPVKVAYMPSAGGSDRPLRDAELIAAAPTLLAQAADRIDALEVVAEAARQWRITLTHRLLTDEEKALMDALDREEADDERA
jgi:hypothetical protein